MGSGDGLHPGGIVVVAEGWGAAVAGSGRDKNAGIYRTQEGQRFGVDVGVIATADRVVDYIYAIGHRLVNGRYQNGRRAATLTGIVGDDIGVGGNTAKRAGDGRSRGDEAGADNVAGGRAGG